MDFTRNYCQYTRPLRKHLPVQWPGKHFYLCGFRLETLLQLVEIGKVCLPQLDIDPPSHESLGNSFGFVDQPKPKQQLYTSPDTRFQRR